MTLATRVTLVAPLRRGESGSAAFLGVADDDQQYWIKPSNNPQGPRSLIPERIVTGIGQLIGAPVCPIALIDIPEDMAFVYQPGYSLRPGVAHGSLNLSPVMLVDDWRGKASRDGNRTRAAFVSGLWDLCLGTDPQWLSHFDEDSAIWSFDHGFWLGGESDLDVAALRRIGASPWSYDGLDTASRVALQNAADAIEALTAESIQEVCHSVPIQWSTTVSELTAIGEHLLARVPGVVARLRQAALTNIHP